MISDAADRSSTRWSETDCTCTIATCRSPLPFRDTTMWLTSRDNGSMMTRVTSPISRSAARTLDLSFGCILFFLDRLRRIHRGILERDQPGGERHNVTFLHKILVLVRHLALLKSFGHPALRIENLLLDILNREVAANIVEFRTALLSALTLQLVAVVTFL